jgi:hypothetical protein
MNQHLLETALRSADPTTGYEPVPPAAITAAVARGRAIAQERTARATRRRRMALGLVAAGVVAVSVAQPLMSEEHAPHAVAIRMVAFRAGESIDLPFGVAVAPVGWHVAAAKGIGGGDAVVALAPPGEGVESDDAITIMRYATARPNFPAGYEGPGPVSTLRSRGRPVTVMQGTAFWAAQVELTRGAVFVVLAPTQLSRDQLKTFLDGLSDTAK